VHKLIRELHWDSVVKKYLEVLRIVPLEDVFQKEYFKRYWKRFVEKTRFEYYQSTLVTKGPRIFVYARTARRFGMNNICVFGRENIHNRTELWLSFISPISSRWLLFIRTFGNGSIKIGEQRWQFFIATSRQRKEKKNMKISLLLLSSSSSREYVVLPERPDGTGAADIILKCHLRSGYAQSKARRRLLERKKTPSRPAVVNDSVRPHAAGGVER